MIVPLNPASHVHPTEGDVPVDPTGQLPSGVQLPEKNGLEDVAAIVPLKPESHAHPAPTSLPVESDGQPVAAQLPEKNGLDDVAAIAR